GMPEAVKDAAADVGDKVIERAQEAKIQARGRVREEVERRSGELGEQISSIGSALQEASRSLREQGNAQAADLSDKAAERLRSFGNYIASADADSLLDDVESFSRRQPKTVAAGGLALGFVASRFLKASSSRRREQNWGGRPHMDGDDDEVQIFF